MPSPISTSILSSVLTPSISDMRARLDVASQEAVTGRRSDITHHLEGRIGAAMIGQKALDDLSIQRDHLSLRGTRLEVAQIQLSFVQEATSGLGVELNAALSSQDERALGLAANDSEASLHKVFTSLNARHGQRYLFSGDATATAPLGEVEDLLTDIRQLATDATDEAGFATALDTYFNDPAGGWQQTIYQGSANISDPDSISADNPALKELISGLAVLAVAKPEDGIALFRGSDTALLAAGNRIFSGQTGVTDVRAGLGLIQEQVQNETEALDVEETVLTQAFNAMTARDQFEAATEVSLLETNLQAAYLLTSRIADLSLLNYLR